jgi:hypothetical protein
MERMEEAGCQVWPRFVSAGICKTAGGYASGHGVRILFFPSVLLFFVVPHWVQCLKDNPLAPINVFGRVSGWLCTVTSPDSN